MTDALQSKINAAATIARFREDPAFTLQNKT